MKEIGRGKLGVKIGHQKGNREHVFKRDWTHAQTFLTILGSMSLGENIYDHLRRMRNFMLNMSKIFIEL